MWDLGFNGLVLAADAVVVLLIARITGRWAQAALVLVWAIVAAAASVHFHQGPFHFLRLLSFLVFLHLPLLLASAAAVNWRRDRRGAVMALIGSVALAGIAVDAFVIEPTWLEVERFEVSSPEVTQSFTIAVVADIQTDRVGRYERTVLARLMELRPDMIVLTGDYLQVADAARRTRLSGELRAVLAEVELDAPLGVFACPGNVEHGSWPTIFDGLPVTTFSRTGSTRAGALQVTGLDLHDSYHGRVARAPDGRFHVVFGHAPDFALTSSVGDLLIAGHTHGGQVRLPFFGPILTLSSVPRSWASGLTHLPDGRILVVSRGIGMERGLAPRLRFLCRPQLVLIEVVPG